MQLRTFLEESLAGSRPVSRRKVEAAYFVLIIVIPGKF
jgi:hypothetical protein